MSYNLRNLFQTPTYVAGVAVADQRLSVADTAVPFATAFNAATDTVLLDVQTADVMVTFDGTAPTTTNGHRLYAGQAFTWGKSAAQRANFIRATGTSAVIHASEFHM